MNLSQLSAFHAVMTSDTLTQAADRLGRTQPAISAAIRSLEDQLDMKLFERRGRKLVPVPEAQYLLNEAGAILSQLHRVRQTMRGLGNGQLGSLNVAAMPGPVSMLFPRFIANHIGGQTGIRTSMLARSSTQIIELARAQSIDFGFADAPPDGDDGGLYRTDIVAADCFVALPRHHPLSKKPALCLADLSGERMGSLLSGHVHTQEVRTAFENAGGVFNPMIESQTFLPIVQFIMAGQCCAILDPLTVVHIREIDAFREALCIRPLVDPIRYRYAVISPSYRPKSVSATELRDAWIAEVHHLLDTLGAHPAWTARTDDAPPPASPQSRD